MASVLACGHSYSTSTHSTASEPFHIHAEVTHPLCVCERERAHGGRMDLVAGTMGNLAPKLLQLLQDEYKLHKGVKAQIKSLADELEATHLALCKVAQVPYDQLDPQVKLWASKAREASYDMEDILDTFLVRVDGSCHQPADADKSNAYNLIKKIRKKFSLSRLKARRDIARAIEEITKQVDEMAKRRDRYKVDDVVGNSATTKSIDPRVLMTFHTKASDLVGIDEPRDALIRMLTMGDDDASDKEMKIVSVVGSGGLGKTTLAKVVYEKLTVDMNISCKAFIPVGRNPDLKKVLRDILLDLDKAQYMNKTNFMILDERQLVKEIQAFLKEKRYFIVIDDVWEVSSWKVIRIAFEDNNLGSKIMITTRHSDVAELVHCTYKIQPLHPDNSKVLFYRRISGSQDKCPEIFSELSDKILRKCGGVPLAIITIASLLANKSDDITEWQEVCNSIGSGLSSSNDMYNDMRKILLLSYYDLPSHMKTCFLYLSMYPEDHVIVRDQLIWKWISEGFIQHQNKCYDLFELGKSYFNDMINRCLVKPVWKMGDEFCGCFVHDMILDLICSLSREENFVTLSDDIEKVMSEESKKLRRLSLKSTSTWPKKGVSQVRSVAVFGPSIDSTPSFSCLDMLRVLDIEDYPLEDCGCSKLSLGNLIHLRYLRLGGRGLKVVPRGIEKLQFLQVLDMDPWVELPESIFGLRQLMCLRGVFCCPRPGNLLRNLASLQELRDLYLDEDSASIVEALGHLKKLTDLSIDIESEMMDQSICDALMNALGNLPRLQHLCIKDNIRLISGERWPHPLQLRRLFLYDALSRMLPKWINPASLPHLKVLIVLVQIVRPEDIQILGTLPNLAQLTLNAQSENYLEQPLQKFVVSAGAFPRLTHCSFSNVAVVPSMFTRGAMPWVEDIQFSLRVRDFFSNPPSERFDFDDLSMDHLPSLRDVRFIIDWETGVTGEDEATKLREALQHTAKVHPNHPKLLLSERKI